MAAWEFPLLSADSAVVVSPRAMLRLGTRGLAAVVASAQRVQGPIAQSSRCLSARTPQDGKTLADFVQSGEIAAVQSIETPQVCNP